MNTRIPKALAALGCTLLLGLGNPTTIGETLGEEIGTARGFSSVGLPWLNPCGPEQASILTRAYMHKVYRPREFQIGDRDMGWSYAVRVDMPDVDGGALDCTEVSDVQYFMVSGISSLNPPLEIPLAITGSLHAALFHEAMSIQPAEPVERDTTAAEVMFFVPRNLRSNVTVHHQGVALVYDGNGDLVQILTANAVSVAVPGKNGEGEDH